MKKSVCVVCRCMCAWIKGELERIGEIALTRTNEMMYGVRSTEYGVRSTECRVRSAGCGGRGAE